MPSVAVGMLKAGPTPQIRPPFVGSFGEKKKLCVVLPKPSWLSSSGRNPFWLTTGRMVREIRFQSSPSEIGMTGWMFSVVCEASPSPYPVW
jgi:hypothetical protein